MLIQILFCSKCVGYCTIPTTLLIIVNLQMALKTVKKLSFLNLRVNIPALMYFRCEFCQFPYGELLKLLKRTIDLDSLFYVYGKVFESLRLVYK